MIRSLILSLLLFTSAFGANDDTEALQHAIDKGTPIESRTYVIDDFVQLPSDCDIDGNGATIKAADQDWNLVAHDRFGMFNADRQKNIRIRNFRFVGLSGRQHGKTPKLIYFHWCDFVTVENCSFVDHNSEGIWGSVRDATFRGLTFERVGRITPGGKWYALPALQPFGDRITIEGNTLLDCGTGIGPTGRDVTVRNNRVVGVLLDGIAIGDSASMAEGPAVVENNYVQLTAETAKRQSGINIVGAELPGPIVVRNNRVMVETTESGIVARGILVNNPTDATLADNRITWTGNSLGLEIYGSDRRSCVSTAGNRFVSLDGNGRAISANPSTGRTVNWHSFGDSIYGTDARSIVVDCWDGRGGTVNVSIENAWIEAGYVRNVKGKMKPMKRERLSL